ncbi:peptidase M4 [Pseudonocardiaceae bacterium YIM PH 21723]|nr:peptidase M4 [Pseudonocardiaceae bacterium YIM PH 21723]
MVSQDHVYVSYDRTYAGLPLVGGDFVVVTDKSGKTVYTSVAQQAPVENVATTATVTKDQAEQTARARLSSVAETKGTRLVVHAVDGPARLAWETTVMGTDADGGPSKQQVYVDALTGAVLRSQELIAHGTGNSAWTGPVTIDTTKSGSSYTTKDPNITNFSCQDFATNQVFTKSTDVWGSGNKADKETVCTDVLFAGQTEKKMLSDWLGRNGQNGNGGAWPVRVGLNAVNAYFTGSDIQIGHNNANQWIGAMDVVSHEMGHGIDSTTPGGMSKGGTQEFVADVFGFATEFYANNATDKPDYDIGEQINLVGSGPIRNAYNPSKVSGHPNCFSSSVPSMEVHAAAGVGNHFFYLLAEGTNPTDGQPTSTSCNNTTLTGIGIKDAAKIFYNAMLMKTSASGYPAYRTWTVQAAKTLGTAQCNAVKAAWSGVSVPAQSGEAAC